MAGSARVAAGPGPGQHLGELELWDLQLINERFGRDPLPYPFMLTRPTRFHYADQVAQYAAHLPERVRTGDLSVFAKCLDAISQPDITVTGHVQYIPADTASIRVLAFRAGQAGYLLQQRADADVVDVSVISPFDLGAVVAAAMALGEPGQHPSVLNAEHVATRPEPAEDDAVVVRHEVHSVPGVRVSADQVSALGKVQSMWQPANGWGIDPAKEALLWVRVIDDGDYLGLPDRSRGIPATTALLAERIDGLIANDVRALRESRGDDADDAY